MSDTQSLEGVDLKLQLAAMKALLLTPWREEITEDVSAFFSPVAPHLKPLALSLRKVNEMELSFDNILHLTRSRSGSCGVFFVRCISSPKNQFVLKLVRQVEKDQFILADRFFTGLGYSTPQTRCVTESSSLRQRLSQFVHSKCNTYIEGTMESLQMQIFAKELLTNKNALLVMRHMQGDSLEEIEEEKLLLLLDSPLFLQTLGEMIFIDAFIGNTDRMTSMACNLGNLMVHDGCLNLIDQRFCLGFPVSVGEILLHESKPIQEKKMILDPKKSGKGSLVGQTFKLAIPAQGLSIPTHEGNASSLMDLLNGEETRNILRQFQIELAGKRRKDAGCIELSDAKIDEMVGPIHVGIVQGFEKVKKLLSNSHALKLLFCHSEYNKSLETSCALLERLLSLQLKNK